MPDECGERIDVAFDRDAKWQRHEARMEALARYTVGFACFLIGLGFGFLLWG